MRMMNRKALIYGIEPELAADLAGVLGQLSVSSRESDSGGKIEWPQAEADVVFTSAEPEWVREVIREVRQNRPELPVIVVSRKPEASYWIDSLEAGADDYCCAPFETVSLRWILEANLGRERQAA